jgi:hypothetical protein
MLKLVPIFAVLFLNPTLAADQDNRVGRLRDVNTVYVAELGQTVKAKNLRQEIMRRLVESKRIRLADAPDKADAVLNVSVTHRTRNVDWPYETFGDGMQIGSKVVNTAEIVLRLDAHQDRTLWSDKFDTGNSSAKNERQATRALANRVSLKFLQAVEKDRKRRR